MREHDKMEFAVAGGDPQEAVAETLRKSAAAWSAVTGGRVACMWGVKEESLVGGAHIWLITTPIIEQYPKRFLAESKRVVNDLVISYQFLYGYVDAQYETSIRWMEWLGFQLAGMSEIGKLRLYRYEMRNGN